MYSGAMVIFVDGTGMCMPYMGWLCTNYREILKTTMQPMQG